VRLARYAAWSTPRRLPSSPAATAAQLSDLYTAVRIEPRPSSCAPKGSDLIRAATPVTQGGDGRARQLPSRNSGPNSAKVCAIEPIAISTIGLNRIIAASRVDISRCAAFQIETKCSRQSPPTARPLSCFHGDQHPDGRLTDTPRRAERTVLVDATADKTL
jgi:hypothetical protein